MTTSYLGAFAKREQAIVLAFTLDDLDTLPPALAARIFSTPDGQRYLGTLEGPVRLTENHVVLFDLHDMAWPILRECFERDYTRLSTEEK